MFSEKIILIKMFVKVSTEDRDNFNYLFDDWKFFSLTVNYIVKNKLGELEVDNLNNPTYAKLFHSRISFIAGQYDKNKANQILESLPQLTAIIFNDNNWYPHVEKFFNEKTDIKFAFQERTKFSSDSLSTEHLGSLKKILPEGFVLDKIDANTIENLPKELTENYTAFFGSAEKFMSQGLGFYVKYGKDIICLATAAFPIVDNLLEIDIKTIDDPKYRRKGLATAACIALIEYCLKEGITPHWDAQDERSAIFAKKLGFTKSEKWKLYFWYKKPE